MSSSGAYLPVEGTTTIWGSKKGGVETSDEIAKTIEHAERAHHGGCRHYNSPHGNRRDEVDGVVTLLGEEIAESNDVGE